MNMKRRLFVAGMGAAFIAPTVGARTQESFPSRPIHFMVASAAGSAPDLLARTIADKLKDAFPKGVVVENRGGAGGTLAHNMLMRAEPDGYTMLLTFTGALTFSPYLYKSVTFDPVKSFQPVMLTATLPNALLVSATLPVNSVADLVKLVKKEPGKYNYGSASYGTSSHLIMELFKSSADLDIMHVPFNSAMAALTSMLQGDTHIHFGLPTPTVNGHIASGKLKILAVTSPTRYSLMPDVPTMVEAGYPALEAIAWNGVLLPAGTPQDIVLRLNKEIRTAMQSPDVKEKLKKQGIEAASGTPEEFAALIKRESEKWKAVIQRAKISLD